MEAEKTKELKERMLGILRTHLTEGSFSVASGILDKLIHSLQSPTISDEVKKTREIIDLYLGDLHNIVPPSEARDNRIAMLRRELNSSPPVAPLSDEVKPNVENLLRKAIKNSKNCNTIFNTKDYILYDDAIKIFIAVASTEAEEKPFPPPILYSEKCNNCNVGVIDIRHKGDNGCCDNCGKVFKSDYEDHDELATKETEYWIYDNPRYPTEAKEESREEKEVQCFRCNTILYADKGYSGIAVCEDCDNKINGKIIS